MNIQLEIKEIGPLRLIGKKVIIKEGKNAKKHWKTYLEDGSNEFIQNNIDKVSPKGDCIGWMGDYNIETKSFIEMPCVFTKKDTAVPDGFDYIDIPKCLVGITWISDNNPNLERGAHNKALKIMKENGYEADYSFGFSMEYYSYDKFINVKKSEDAIYTFGYILPCKIKERS